MDDNDPNVVEPTPAPEDDTQWLQIRDVDDGSLSWHIFLTYTRVPGQIRVMCDRNAMGDVVDAFPPGEKTCESCLREQAKARERA